VTYCNLQCILLILIGVLKVMVFIVNIIVIMDPVQFLLPLRLSKERQRSYSLILVLLIFIYY